jgi:hypothetical protein
VSRFWAALDQPSTDRVRAFEEIYLRQGTPGLKDFLRLRIGSAEELAATVKEHEAFYRSIRSTTVRAEEFEDQIRAASSISVNYCLRPSFPTSTSSSAS